MGENSTGKSTFMAMLDHLSQPAFASLRPSFNNPPFDLGTYDSIATFKGGRYGRADKFYVGIVEDGDEGGARRTVATYNNYRGQPQLLRYEASLGSAAISFEMLDAPNAAQATITVEGRKSRDFPINLKEEMEAGIPIFYLLQRIVMTETGGPLDSRIMRLARVTRHPTIPELALAPIRT